MTSKNTSKSKPSSEKNPNKQIGGVSSVTESEIHQKQMELKAQEKSLKEMSAVIEQKQNELKDVQETVSKKEAELNKKRLQLEEQEIQAKNSFPALFEEKFADFKTKLEEREAQCESEWSSIESEKEELRKQKLSIQRAEIERDKGYAEERSKLDEELYNQRINQEKELEIKRKESLKSIEQEVLKERNRWISKLEKEKTDLQKERVEIETRKDDLNFKERKLQSSEESLERRVKDLDEEIESGVEERKKSFEINEARLNDEIDRLRDCIKTSDSYSSIFEELKRNLGDKHPAEVLLELKTLQKQNSELLEELTTRPTLEMLADFDKKKSELKRLKDTVEQLTEDKKLLKKAERDQSELEAEIADLTAHNSSLQTRLEMAEANNNKLSEELKRSQASYERKQERKSRIEDIESPYFQKTLHSLEKIEELEWLENISKSCIDYGLRFPQRILNAFHTALKTSEWSPITVLAGVSGTGKSELPRLYSHFGGINFLSLSVQPNWDSQESMLGFFNSIDNKFDAQPVLRLLAQSQKAKSDEYPYGLKDFMSLILMDEMNLAHVELYFAEFLSKLELRRGRKGTETPNLEVKLGAGIQHYDLPLGRNVLWAGTMNQDETTKSLSDKVIDRGIIINFPRPTTLERRSVLKQLGDQSDLLPRKEWESWWCKKSDFEESQISEFKRFIESMNESLSKVGRALGHRVWQSIEYYMANYPTVMEAQRQGDEKKIKEAMKIAFEDQLVQKVMPKLRGIETRGKAKTDCLDKIREQLNDKDYSIIEDFDLACEFGYGQFIWFSANYLRDEITLDNDNTPSNENEKQDQSDDNSSN